MAEVSTELKSKLQDLIDFYETSKKSNENRSIEIDREIVDIYHDIEFHPNLNAAAGYAMYKKLSKVLIERRTVKDNIAAISSVDGEALKLMLQRQVFTEVNEKTRTYRVRSGEYENIPGVHYMNTSESVEESIKVMESTGGISKDRIDVPEGYTVNDFTNGENVYLMAKETDLKQLYYFSSISDAATWLKKTTKALVNAKTPTVQAHIIERIKKGKTYAGFYWYYTV